MQVVLEIVILNQIQEVVQEDLFKYILHNYQETIQRLNQMEEIHLGVGVLVQEEELN